MTIDSIPQIQPAVNSPVVPAVNPPAVDRLVTQAEAQIREIAFKRDMTLAEIVGIVHEHAREAGGTFSEWQQAVVAAADKIEADLKLLEPRRAVSSWSYSYDGQTYGGRICRQCHKSDCGHMRRKGAK